MYAVENRRKSKLEIANNLREIIRKLTSEKRKENSFKGASDDTEEQLPRNTTDPTTQSERKESKQQKSSE